MEMGALQVLTDSLTSLRLLRGWPTYFVARVLRCADRVEVRRVLQLAASCAAPPILEKVQAHDVRAVELGHPKAVGNDREDFHANTAALNNGMTAMEWDPLSLEDAVLFRDSVGSVVRDVRQGLAKVNWRSWGSAPRRLCPLMDLLYPGALDVDWGASTVIFRRPVVSLPAVVWAARPGSHEGAALVEREGTAAVAGGFANGGDGACVQNGGGDFGCGGGDGNCPAPGEAAAEGGAMPAVPECADVPGSASVEDHRAVAGTLWLRG